MVLLLCAGVGLLLLLGHGKQTKSAALSPVPYSQISATSDLNYVQVSLQIYRKQPAGSLQAQKMQKMLEQSIANSRRSLSAAVPATDGDRTDQTAALTLLEDFAYCVQGNQSTCVQKATRDAKAVRGFHLQDMAH